MNSPILSSRLQEPFAGMLSDSLTAVGMRANFRVNAAEAWSAISSELDYLPVDYSRAVLDYYLTYWPGIGVPVQDASLILLHDNRPCAIWPLSLTQNEKGGWRLGSNGGAIKPPLFISGLPKKTSKSLCVDCLAMVEIFCRQLGQADIESEEGCKFGGGLSDWHDRMMQGGGRAELQHDMFLDLAPSMAEIKSTFRKSYKALVTSGAKLWTVHLLTTEDSLLWQEFQSFHRFVAGRVTRCDKSWKANHDAIASGDAFFVCLRNVQDEMVGGGLFYVTKSEGLYSIGAYDKNLFEKPLGHVVQYHAIQEMKRRGISWYRLGVRCYPGESSCPSEKELSISSFKQGFSSHLFPRYRISRSFRPNLPEK